MDVKGLFNLFLSAGRPVQKAYEDQLINGADRMLFTGVKYKRG